MRLWSLNPKYLDSKGLVALWREALLAQKVLSGDTKGYRNHPQLHRFKSAENPIGAISTYLRFVAIEADRRRYNFDKTKITESKFLTKIPVTRGQLEYEVSHLLAKLKIRDNKQFERIKDLEIIETHPLITRRVTPQGYNANVWFISK